MIEDDLDGAVDPVPGGARGDGRSVLGAVAVLEFVASRASSAAPGVVEIARAVGREKSVVSRNLRTLVGAGLLVRDTVGAGYRIGPRIYRIAAGVREARIEELGERAVAALADRFGERSELYVRAGNLAMTVATASPDAPLQVVGWRGRTYSLTASAAGRALLFDLPDAEVRRLVENVGAEHDGPNAPHSVEEVLERLTVDRSRGVSVADEEADRDLLAVAAPIRGAEGRVIASIVVSGPARRLRERLDEVPAALQQHAIEVSAELGHVGPAPAAPRTAS